MSMTATHRVFNTPELVHLIAACLHKADLSRFLRTNRHLLLWIQPLLYKHTVACFLKPHANVLVSPYSIQALARNALSVRSLGIGLAEVAHLYNCFRAFEQQEEEKKQGLVTPSQSLTVTSDSRAIPLPPMRGLKCLTVLEPFRYHAEPCPYLPPITTSNVARLEQACWILQMSERLEQVLLNGLLIRHRQDFITLAKAIASVPNLKVLHLGVQAKENQPYYFPDPFRAWSSLFFACRSSVQVFKVTFPCPSVNGTDAISGGQGEDGSTDGGQAVGEESAMPRRQDPLSSLTDLTLPQAEDGTTGEDIKRILNHCPNLKSIHAYDQESAALREDLARTIASCCPLLNDVCFDSLTFATNGPTLPYQLISAIEEHQLEKLRWNSSKHIVRGPEPTGMFSRHSRSLRKVVLEMHCWFESKVLCSVLNVCVALEEFRVEMGRAYSFKPLAYIKLDDLGVTPWASTKLRHLDISIGIPVLPHQELLHNSASENTYSNGERQQQQLALLERLYRQLGALTQLQNLRLKAFLLDERGEPHFGHYADNTFPAMLSLGDSEGSGRPGYLEYLGGLTKLRQLKGSVYANTNETKVTIGWPEARWMASHWPELEVAEFFPNEDEATEPFVWLKSQYKESQLVLKAGPFDYI